MDQHVGDDDALLAAGLAGQVVDAEHHLDPPGAGGHAVGAVGGRQHPAGGDEGAAADVLRGGVPPPVRHDHLHGRLVGELAQLGVLAADDLLLQVGARHAQPRRHGGEHRGGLVHGLAQLHLLEDGGACQSNISL